MASTFAVTDPTNLFDNNYVTDATTYRVSSPFARWVFRTSAIRCFLKIQCTIFGTYPDFVEIAVLVNGSLYMTLSPEADGETVYSFDLPAGSKRIELVTGLQSKPSSLRGTFLKSVYFSGAGDTAQETPTAPQIVVYGDSIAGGGNADNPPIEAWPVLLRSSYGYRVAVEAWGYRSLFADAPDAAGRTALSTQLAGYAPTVGVWLAIGTNDYGLETQSAADFGTAYSDLLDKLHVDLPTATIYCQTPLVRSSEVANSFGDTLGAYRTATGTAVGAREYAVLVDGSAFLTTALLEDGVHPTTAGHADIAADAAGVLG